jgi:hypothetical protein
VVLEKRSEFSENLTEFLMKSHWYFDKNSVSFSFTDLSRPGLIFGGSGGFGGGSPNGALRGRAPQRGRAQRSAPAGGDADLRSKSDPP